MPREVAQPFWARDWALIAESKRAFWLEEKRRFGRASGLRIADQLRRQVLAQRPDWPSESERRADLEGHLRVLEILDRASQRRKR